MVCGANISRERETHQVEGFLFAVGGQGLAAEGLVVEGRGVKQGVKRGIAAGDRDPHELQGAIEEVSVAGEEGLMASQKILEPFGVLRAVHGQCDPVGDLIGA